MAHDLIKVTASPFDSIRQCEDGQEYWSARDLQKLMSYIQWRQFEDAIERAMIACKNSGQAPSDHFADARKPIIGGKGAIQQVKDYRLTRYACYLVAMNSDPRKGVVSQAQTYFALKTREAELAVLPLQTPVSQINSLWQQRLEIFNRETHLPAGYWCVRSV
jgi:DNA-damage-inducible protein D